MDQEIIKQLLAAGHDPTLKRSMITIPIKMDPVSRNIEPLDDTVAVMQAGVNESVTFLRLRPLAELLTGDRRPPEFGAYPSDEYTPFFWMIEATAIDYCKIRGIPEYDEEFERLYNHLRRRPDGSDNNPLFSYLRAAVQLYASLFAVSIYEHEAVANRLKRSARCFHSDVTSTTYIRRFRAS